ncbi:hypothetical protein FG152_26475 [Ochrobactrum sp. XJ1]|nr:hypothetical protein [Ochrobactrum sp. XJ1]
MMNNIVSLDEARARRSGSQPVDDAFAQAWMLIFDALELVEDIPTSSYGSIAYFREDHFSGGRPILLSREKGARHG